jgi:hypothetical protein
MLEGGALHQVALPVAILIHAFTPVNNSANGSSDNVRTEVRRPCPVLASVNVKPDVRSLR